MQMTRRQSASAWLHVFAVALLAVAVFPSRAAALDCDTEPTDMSVQYGAPVNCMVQPATDTDLFRFSGTAGDRVLVEALFLSGDAAFQPKLRILAPNGTILVQGEWSPARADLLLTQTGTYTAIISDNQATYVGQFAFTVSCTAGACLPTPPPPPNPAPGGDIACEPEPTDMFPHFGTRVTCGLAPGTDTDIYRFSGSTGDRVLVEALFVSGDPSFAPAVQVIAPNGVVLASATWNPARHELVLPQAGVYTAVVTSHSVANQGIYAFTVSCLGGKCLPEAGPNLVLTLTGCTACRAGDMFRVQARWSNPRLVGVNTEIKIGFRRPDGVQQNSLGNKHLEYVFPANFDVSAQLLSLPWPNGQPQGTWTIEGALVGPTLGETFSREVKTFTVVP